MWIRSPSADARYVTWRGSKIAVAVALCALAGAVAAPGALSGKTRTRVTLTALESGVLADLYQIRAQHGLKPVRINARLTAAATQHSREMGTAGYFQHESHDGTAFWKRVGRYYASSGYGYWSVGENLLWSAPDVSATKAMQMWLHSPEHRANLMNPRWREIGIAAVHQDAAPGVYKGMDVTIVTTDFGVRK